MYTSKYRKRTLRVTARKGHKVARLILQVTYMRCIYGKVLPCKMIPMKCHGIESYWWQKSPFRGFRAQEVFHPDNCSCPATRYEDETTS